MRNNYCITDCEALDAKLCEALNALEVRYTGTDLTLAYQAPGVAKILTPMSGALNLAFASHATLSYHRLFQSQVFLLNTGGVTA